MKTNGRTKQKREEMLSLYKDIVESTNTLIWRTDAEGRFTFLNPAWEKVYGYGNEEMLGRNFSDFQATDAAGHYVNAFRNCLIGEQVIGHETAFFSKKGDEVYLAINLIPLYSGDREIVGTQGTAFDVTERKHADKLFQYLSAKDELTGLYNIHTFLSMSEQQIKTAHREKKEMLVIYAGVDGMRSINEVYGREAGDGILMDTANILRKTFREADVLARTGGDEFVVSTLVSSEKTEEMIISRLDDNIAKHNAGKSGPPELSLSLGVSFYNPGCPVLIEEVLSKADENMHLRKKLRKD
ncbi:MAG: GGDEF domain-containing protein [Nitrospirae bacterium]|nr:GGDEF domain-containing protein [Nitrospirota bacterium]